MLTHRPSPGPRLSETPHSDSTDPFEHSHCCATASPLKQSISRIRSLLDHPGGVSAVARRRRPARNLPTGLQVRNIDLPPACSSQERVTARTLRWRRERRPDDLRTIAHRLKQLRWSPRLVELLVEELYVTDELLTLLAPIRRLPVERYPQLVALALALRHSWRPDDLRGIAKRLGVRRKRNE